ncbi:replication protein RepA [Acidisphaera sp. L21]|uniref:replication protein RepA n=1 Tax=Acidisphaera sp. L21 TaxID=1641851 RepID=UPI0015776395|nr:replication protein RepA [Acidisphaera sp. L21]
MGEIHELLLTQGKQATLANGANRSVVEAAASYMADEDSGLGFAYSGWAQCALPHKKIADDARWSITSERVLLVVEPGLRRINQTSELEPIGVPFGSHARLILLYLQTEALRTKSREVELGRSMRNWLERLNVSYGGKTGQSVRDQAERISRCRLTFHLTTGSEGSGLVNQNIVDRALFIDGDDKGGQGRLTLETAKLSEGFYEQLKKHPVPLEESAIRSLASNAPALDAYLWLAYRLHVLKSPKLVSWTALKGQFGTAYSKLSSFKQNFTHTLAMATAVYPDAKLELLPDGVVLKPSKPPVQPRQISVPKFFLGTGTD